MPSSCSLHVAGPLSVLLRPQGVGGGGRAGEEAAHLEQGAVWGFRAMRVAEGLSRCEGPWAGCQAPG